MDNGNGKYNIVINTLNMYNNNVLNSIFNVFLHVNINLLFFII